MSEPSLDDRLFETLFLDKLATRPVEVVRMAIRYVQDKNGELDASNALPQRLLGEYLPRWLEASENLALVRDVPGLEDLTRYLALLPLVAGAAPDGTPSPAG